MATNNVENSESKESVDAQTNVEAGKGDTPESNEALAKLLNARLLEESKKWKKEAQEAKAKLTSLEKSKLEEQGQYKQLYEAKAKENEELVKRVKESALKSQLEVAAQKHGFIDPEIATLVGNRELLVFDENATRFEGIDDYFEDLKRRKPHFFQASKSVNVNPSKPGVGLGSVVNVPTDKRFSKLSPQEQLAKLMELETKRKQ